MLSDKNIASQFATSFIIILLFIIQGFIFKEAMPEN